LAEWSIAAVLKTVVPEGTGGSNPSASAFWEQFTQKIKGDANILHRLFPFRNK
jgi:accessory colonization factor AcfC